MKFWPFREKSEHRAADFGAALAQAYEALAGGAAGVDTAQTAAAEFSIGAWGRAFAVAEVSGIQIPASVLEQIGRSLALRGNFVADVTANPMTGLALLPASSWDIVGSADPSTWTYHATLAGPSMQHTVTRTSAEIIHARVNSLPESPWAGRSPLVSAGFSAKLAANIEERASQEAHARAGTMLPTPPLSEASRAALKTDLGALKGGVALVEAGGGNAPRPTPGGQPNDWTPRRFGLTYTEPNVMLRAAASADVVSSFGIPSALFSGSDGSLVREGWRQFGVAVQAWGKIVSDELSLKLERTIALSFRELASIDVAARARAMGVLVNAGLDVEAALKEAGLGDES